MGGKGIANINKYDIKDAHKGRQKQDNENKILKGTKSIVYRKPKRISRKGCRT